jgi:Acetyltransferase (GNAT) domain
MMSPMPAMVVRAAVPQDFDAIIGLVAGMFQDLGTTEFPDAWRDDLQQALASRLCSDVAAFVAVGPAGVPIAVAVGIIDQRLPSPRRSQGQIGYIEWLATTAVSRRQGAARSATAALLQWFDEHEIDVVEVHSSPSAQPIYSSLGFNDPTSRPMRRKRKHVSGAG